MKWVSFAAILLFDMQIAFSAISDSEFEKHSLTFIHTFSEEVEHIFGKPLSIKVWDYDGTAFAQCSDETCEIVVFKGFLDKSSIQPEHLDALLCHEVGHFLGKRFTNESVLSVAHSSPYAVEGEADYFLTSKCLPRLWKNTDQMLQVVYELLSLGGAPSNKNGENPYMRDPRLGTNMSYPSRECRFASSYSGSLKLERPSCWYVPNDLIPKQLHIQ